MKQFRVWYTDRMESNPRIIKALCSQDAANSYMDTYGPGSLSVVQLAS